ncbi:MAG TPA: NADP-dependent oxidoreductase, partial [Methylomirabilota bacterium]|nr:NADP-dependent oxidoreductase [Methylomirabilota bacterium]
MKQNTNTNRRIVLASRPSGAPIPENFRLGQAPVPVPRDRQVLLRTVYLSLDPYMRGRMNDGPSYAPPVELESVMVGGTICRVEASKHPHFSAGDLVLGFNGWQDYALSDGSGLTKLPTTLARPSYALGVLGMPGFTAYMGLLDIGRPKESETVVVAAATGAVGSVVGQVGKLKGCRVIGIAGGSEKCRYAVQELGFDACIDHRSHDLADQLAQACPNRIDVYFENVGGAVFDAVLPLLNVRARIPLCGLIAYYNDNRPREGVDRLPLLLNTLLTRRIEVRGFIIFEDYGPRFGEFFNDMSSWVAEGKIKYREDVVDGLENTPQAFIGLLEGENFG